MRLLWILTLFVWIPVAEAHVPVLVEQTSLNDIEEITDPELSRAFYGTLDGFPHTFEIRATEPFSLHVGILVPDIERATNNINGIIITELGEGEGVKEVARLHAKDAAWESFKEPIGADTYRRGGEYTAEVPAGVYRIEVSTPDNREPYVLVVGKREGGGDVGYFETIRRLMEVKAFFDKPRVAVIFSPLVYIPLFVIGVLGGLLVWWRRRSVRNRAVVE